MFIDLSFAEVIGLREDTTIITTGKEPYIDGESLSPLLIQRDHHQINSDYHDYLDLVIFG
jgi:hypothetical protein